MDSLDFTPASQSCEAYVLAESIAGEPFWADFGADLGDGFDTTYAVAHMMAADHLYPEKKAVGLNAIAYVHVALRDHQENSIADFLRLVETEPQIVECASITGDHDFILKVYARTPEDLEVFIMKRLLKSGLVRDTRSNFVLRQNKTRGPLPIL